MFFSTANLIGHFERNDLVSRIIPIIAIEHPPKGEPIISDLKFGGIPYYEFEDDDIWYRSYIYICTRGAIKKNDRANNILQVYDQSLNYEQGYGITIPEMNLFDTHWPFHHWQQRCTKEKELKDAGIAIPDGAGLKKSYTLKGPSSNASTLGILCKPQLLDHIFLFYSKTLHLRTGRTVWQASGESN